MSKHTIIALVLLIVFITVLLLVGGKVNIPILKLTIKDVPTNFALLGSMVVGVIIGALLK